MGDHFWPALYPGLIVGLLYGLSQGGTWNIILGVAGGLAGAAVTSTLIFSAGVEQGLISALGMIGGSILGAYAVSRLGQRLRSQ